MCSFQGVFLVYFDCIVALAYEAMNFFYFCVLFVDDGVADSDSEKEISSFFGFFVDWVF